MTAVQSMSAFLLIGVIGLLGSRSGDVAQSDALSQRTTAPSVGLPPDIHADSLARLPKVKREDLDAEGQRVYDLIVNPASRYRDGLWGPVGMWMHSPPMAEHMFAASTYLRFGTALDQRLTELAILVTARELDAQFEWTSHEPSALRAGLEPAIVDIVKHRKSTAGLGPTEALIIQFGRELIGAHKLSAPTFAKALSTFGRQGVTNLTGLMAYYRFNTTFIDALNVHLRADQKPLLPPIGN